MTYYEHIPFRENIPAYAVGALDAEDAAALETHLRHAQPAGTNWLLTVPQVRTS